MAEAARSSRVVSTSLLGYTLGGFVAGEGCFTISTTSRVHKNGDPIKKFVFSVNIRTRDVAMLESLRDFLGVGSISQRSEGNPKWEPTSTFVVNSEGSFFRTGNRFRFAIGLGARDRGMCELAARLLGVGTITSSTRRKPHYDDEVRFAVGHIKDQLNVVIPFMDEYLPPSLKRDQYLAWREALLDFWENHARRRRPCTVDGCSEPQRGRGVCRRHYYRLFGK